MTNSRIQTNAQLVHAAGWATAALDLHTEEGEALQTLRAISYARDTLTRGTAQAVAEARAQGKSWAEVGDALGMTRQGAWEQFSGA